MLIQSPPLNFPTQLSQWKVSWKHTRSSAATVAQYTQGMWAATAVVSSVTALVQRFSVGMKTVLLGLGHYTLQRILILFAAEVLMSHQIERLVQYLWPMPVSSTRGAWQHTSYWGWLCTHPCCRSTLGRQSSLRSIASHRPWSCVWQHPSTRSRVPSNTLTGGAGYVKTKSALFPGAFVTVTLKNGTGQKVMYIALVSRSQFLTCLSFSPFCM